MNDFLTFVVVGLAGGSSYALLALGLVLVYSVSRVLNFAQAAFGSMAAYIAASVAIGHDLSWPLAIVAAVSIGIVSGVGAAWILLGRGGGTLPPLVGTVGILAGFALIEARYLGGTRPFPTPVHGDGIEVLGVVITPTRMLVMATLAVAALALWVALERTRLGLALRAGADNRDGANIVGLDPRRLEIVAWGVAGFLGALAGVTAGWTTQTLTPGFLTAVLPQGFAAAMIGGMVSLPGAVIGGLSIGVLESLTRRYWGGTPGSPELLVFLVLVAVLLFRPQGLFGKRGKGLATEGSDSLVRLDPTLVDSSRAARTGAGRVLKGSLPLAAVLILTVAIPLAVGDSDAFRLSLIPVYAVLALSVNFLASSTGQVSLGQAGLFGLGAFGAAMATTTWELPPLLGFATGALMAGLVATLLGAASLRIRGLYLAVLTLAFGVVLQAFVFPTSAFSKGGAGLAVSRPEIGPFDLGNDRVFLGSTVLMLGLTWVIMRAIVRLPLGRGLVAVRENQTASAARGIQTTTLGVIGFAISGMFAGLAGATFAFRQGIVVASSFPLSLSLTVVIWVVLGGLGSRVGVVAVTAVLIWVQLYASGSNQLISLLAAAAVVLTIGRWPLGIAGAFRALTRRRHARPLPAHGAHEVDDEAVAPAGPRALIDKRPASIVVPLPNGTSARPVILAVRDVSVRFGGNMALSQVSLDVYPGELIGILGPNGAGKTTLFNVLSGFQPPAQGQVWFRGERINGVSPAQRVRLGLGRSFQQGGLWPSESAHSNLMMAQYGRLSEHTPGGIIGLTSSLRADDRRRSAVAHEVLAVLGLSAEADRPVQELPYGHRKVLELGCAIATQPKVLLLDEPAAGLHGSQLEWIGTAISALRRELGITVVVIEHDVRLVRTVSDRIYVLDFGHMLTDGLPDEVLARPEVIEAYLGRAAAEQSS